MLGRIAMAGVALSLAAAQGAGAQAPEARMKAVLDGVVASHPTVPGASAAVDAPRHGVRWKGAAGRFAHGSPHALHADDPYRMASVTKIYVAAAVLRLAEDGRLALDDPIARHLPPEIVNRVNTFGGTNHGPRITLRHLLNHTSGIASHDEDPAFLVTVAAMPDKRWTPEEQIDIAIRMGATAEPGREWAYSDTGFVMLGLVISRVTGKDLGTALRELLGFDRLGLGATWHELLEPGRAPGRARAHQYFAAVDVTGHDPSFDSWGGGGLAATSEDMADFMRTLFRGRVFRRPQTLAEMLTTVPVQRDIKYAHHYGLGIGHWDILGEECWGHPGVWSSAAFYCPGLDAAVAGTTNQASDETGDHTEDDVIEGLVKILRELPRRPGAPLELSVHPQRLRAGRRATLRFRATVEGAAVPSAIVSLSGRRAVTRPDGTARLRLRPRRRGLRAARACAPDHGCATARLRVVR